MRTCMPLNQKGMSLVVVLVVLGVVGAAAVVMMTNGVQKRKISQQMNVSVSANLVKQKLVGLVSAPKSWQKTQVGNSAAIISFVASSPPSLDIYTPDSVTPYYAATNPYAGFDLNGNTCTSFSTTGNDACPFHYDIRLQARVFQNGNWIDTIRFTLSFRPATSALVLNAADPAFSFDLVRNLNEQSVEAACISMLGIYNAETNQCSVKITNAVAPCTGGDTYRGPAVNVASNNCDAITGAGLICAPTQVVKGFNSSGDPVCGDPL